MTEIIIALDQGTTSTRCIAFDVEGNIIKLSQKPIHITYPNNGWVEQDAIELWQTSRDVISDVISKLDSQPMVLGITNQRETTIFWNRKTGLPIAPAIVWQDRRTANMCNALRAKGLEDKIREKTGLLLDPYFSATKIKWLLDNMKGVRDLAFQGDLLFGTVDTWVLWNLTGGKMHVTDATNASRTMLYNLDTQDWDDELLDIFSIPKSIMPEIRDCISDFGYTKIDGINFEIPIRGIAGDQQAALIGQECFERGDCKSTFGTGAFLLTNCGDQKIISNNRLLTTVAYKINGESTFALEGAIFIAGALIQWLRDNMKFFEHSDESEALARSVDSSDGVCVVPAFTGLGAPWWLPDARGIITGLSRDTNSAHITRASLEAQAFQTYDLLSAMEKDMGAKILNLHIDGGLAANNFVGQHLADILLCDVHRKDSIEATAWGAAYLAGVGIGAISHFGQKFVGKNKIIFQPSMPKDIRNQQINTWNAAVQQVVRSHKEATSN